MATKLLLIEDVDDLGRSGDIVNVKAGFSRNYLLPQGFAVVADKNTLRMQARLQEERKKKAIIDKQEAEKTAATVEGVTLSTIVKVDQEGHMYGSVNAHDIAVLLQEKTNVHLEKRAIGIKHPIKELGTHKINIKLKEGITTSITLTIEPEDPKFAVQQPEEAPAAE